MKNALYIGKIAGIKLFVHWTFPLIIFWIILSNLQLNLNATQITWSVIFVLALFVCVTLHEFGHALAAKRFHIQTIDITLLPIGGVARMQKIPEKPVHELIVALAGPAVNFVIVLLLFVVLRLTNQSVDILAINYVSAHNFLLSLAVVNFFLGIFNLVPAFPMDGGRVLRAVLSFWLNRVLATRIAASIGQLLAIGFIFFGFMFNPFLIFIGIFIFIGAMTEAEQVKTDAALKGHTVENITMKKMPFLNRQDTIGKAVELLLNGPAKNFLIMDNEQPFGTLGRDEIIRALKEYDGQVSVEVGANLNPGFIDAGDSIENALLMMQQDKQTMLIVTKNNQLYGVTDMENILEYIMVMNAKASSNK